MYKQDEIEIDLSDLEFEPDIPKFDEVTQITHLYTILAKIPVSEREQFASFFERKLIRGGVI